MQPAGLTHLKFICIIEKSRILRPKKHFRPEYRYRAWQAGAKEKIIEMALNGSGARDTGRALRISKGTVCSV
jgi:hypothetical protein